MGVKQTQLSRCALICHANAGPDVGDERPHTAEPEVGGGTTEEVVGQKCERLQFPSRGAGACSSPNVIVKTHCAMAGSLSSLESCRQCQLPSTHAR